MTLSSSRLTRGRFANSDQERRNIAARAKDLFISPRQPCNRGYLDHGFSTGSPGYEERLTH